MPHFQDGLIRLGAIGNRPEDSPEQRLHHRLVIYMGCLMSIGGLVWGTLSLSFESILPALVPYGYVIGLEPHESGRVWLRLVRHLVRLLQ